jgi:threonine dehydrogenase-like Zn-dependent dehydrogenase
MGNCHHRKYLPKLVELVSAGVIDPARILTKVEPLTDALDAYKAFDRRAPGWLKVKLQLAA